ncbi:hypothetical protein PRIPAC_85885, partial [Pristionchus pacificus]
PFTDSLTTDESISEHQSVIYRNVWDISNVRLGSIPTVQSNDLYAGSILYSILISDSVLFPLRIHSISSHALLCYSIQDRSLLSTCFLSRVCFRPLSCCSKGKAMSRFHMHHSSLSSNRHLSLFPCIPDYLDMVATADLVRHSMYSTGRVFLYADRIKRDQISWSA